MSAFGEVTVATAESFGVGEGPRWDGVRQRLLWVDIPRGTVLAGRLDNGMIHVTDRWTVDSTVGAVSVTDSDLLLVAGHQTLFTLGLDGTAEPVVRIVDEHSTSRLNDGAVDPSGRYLVGTLDLAGPSSSEKLVRVEPDRSLTPLDDDLTMSNGIAWSTEGNLLYTVDTVRGLVYVRDYDALGTIGPRRVHLRVDRGNPDGIAVDSADHLWVAVWGEGEVRRYSPQGTLTAVLRVPAPHTSAIAFAGNDLRTLVITTASDGVSDAQLARFPNSGRLFTTRVDVPGLPATPWSATADVVGAP